MWFGDLVTMRWFDDVWMKEVFANFMAAKIVNPSFPEINHDLRFLLAHYPAAYDIDRTPGTNAIRQRLDNLNEAGSALRRDHLSEGADRDAPARGDSRRADRFRDGLREYLTRAPVRQRHLARSDRRARRAHARGSRGVEPCLGRRGGTADRRHRSRRSRTAGSPGWRFAQRDPRPARGLLWNQRLQVPLGLPDGVRTLPVRIADGAASTCPRRAACRRRTSCCRPAAASATAASSSMPASSTYLLRAPAEIADPLTRGAAWVTLWDQMLDRRARPDALIDAARSARCRARPTSRTCSGSSTTRSRRTGGSCRRPSARRVAARSSTCCDRASTPRRRRASSRRGFRRCATSARSPTVVALARARLARRRTRVPGLTLAEPDYMTLALRARGARSPAWQRDPRRAAARIENPDRRARFAFVRPALSPDQAASDAFFETLKDAANRQREPWVLEGLAYLHHPLRAAASEKYIPASLALLREIQRTGDIFFPKRWMDATLGGHSSASGRADGATLSRRCCLRTIPTACAASSCRRQTICSGPAACRADLRGVLTSCASCDGARRRCRRRRSESLRVQTLRVSSRGMSERQAGCRRAARARLS